MIGPQNVAQSALLIKSRWLFIHRTYDNTHVNEIVLQKAQKCNTGTEITDVRCDIFSNYQQIIIMVKHVNESLLQLDEWKMYVLFTYTRER